MTFSNIILCLMVIFSCSESQANHLTRLINRWTVPVVGLACSEYLVRFGIAQFRVNFYAQAKVDKDDYLFNGRVQAVFREQLKGKYPENKPVFFGISTMPHALSLSDAYYAFFPMAPEVSLGFFHALSLMVGLQKINVDTLFGNLSQEDVARYIQKDGFVINHELGHLYLGHHAQLNDANKKATVGVVGASLIYNLWAMTRTTNSFISQASRGGLMVLTLPCSYGLIKAYLYNKSRRNEQEADDFAIRHAKSPQELIRGQQFLLEQQAAAVANDPDSLLGRFAHVQQRLFSSHPPINERVEKLQEAIDTWDSRNV